MAAAPAGYPITIKRSLTRAVRHMMSVTVV